MLITYKTFTVVIVFGDYVDKCVDNFYWLKGWGKDVY